MTLTPNRQLRVGRDNATELPLSHPTVSKVHARIAVDSTGQVTVFDLKSTNGTAVNGRRVRRAPLRAGDHLEVGDVPLRLDLLSQDELNHLQRVCDRLEEPGNDPQTGLYPSTYLTQDLLRIVSRCERTTIPLSILAVSIDRFADVGDIYGSHVGSSVLKGVARLTALAVRDDDPCVKGGDDHILVFLPGSTAQSALEVAERIRRIIAGHDWARDATRLLITTSIGVATRSPAEAIDAWIGRALHAARKAAASGRNRVEQAVVLPLLPSAGTP